MSEEENMRKYGKITVADRVKLIKIFEEGGKTIKGVADEIGIKASTARAILKKYHKSGEVFQRKEEQKIRVQKEIQSLSKTTESQSEPEKTENGSFQGNMIWIVPVPTELMPYYFPQLYRSADS